VPVVHRHRRNVKPFYTTTTPTAERPPMIPSLDELSFTSALRGSDTVRQSCMQRHTTGMRGGSVAAVRRHGALDVVGCVWVALLKRGSGDVVLKAECI
jgi:hypothetical protein